MSNNNHRILLNITMLSGDDPKATEKANSTYWRFNNVLNGNSRLPNITKICDCCSEANEELGAYIRNNCIDIKKENPIYDPSVAKANSILSIIKSSERKNIRIMIYPGKRNDIAGLNMKETTHNMIVQFGEENQCFIAAEPHAIPPSFYQCCPSEDVALLYFEALLVDACMCHYLGISDAAYHHDDKQRISSEKILFIKKLVKDKNWDFLSPRAQILLEYVNSILRDDTPYISFLSIFTIASLDKFDDGFDAASSFKDYCALWGEFQKWYFNKHGRMFSKQQEIENPLETVFDRNRYQGQISPSEIAKKLREVFKKALHQEVNAPFGVEHRYAIVIISRVPDSLAKKAQFKALFSGKLHQSKWDIIYWKDLEKYEPILDYLEVVPIMLME